MDARGALVAAESALADGDEARALDALLDAWRAARTLEIADLCETVGARVQAREPPARSSGSASQRQAWLATAAERRPAALGRLLEVLTETRVALAVERLRALLEWPPDPRITTALLGWLDRAPYDGTGRRRFFPPLLELLARQEDPRALATLVRLCDPAARTETIRRIGQAQLEQLRALHERHLGFVARATSAGEHDAIATVRARIGQSRAARVAEERSAEELLAEVYARPDDDAPRLVYADLLQERGDPRGELITLQCARHASGREPSRRERELLKLYERVWLGAIEGAVLRSGVQYERGFVAACRYKYPFVEPRIEASQPGGVSSSPARSRTSMEDLPEWSTVVEIDVSQHVYVGGTWRLLLGGRMPALRRVLGLRREDIERVLAHQDALRWDTVGMDVPAGHVTQLLATCTSLPVLRALALSEGDASLQKLLATDTGRRLERLSFAAPWSRASHASLALATLGFSEQLREVWFQLPHVTLVLHRAAGGSIHVRARLERCDSYRMDLAVTALKSLPVDSVRRVELECKGAVVEQGLLVQGKSTVQIAPLFIAAERLGATDVALPRRA